MKEVKILDKKTIKKRQRKEKIEHLKKIIKQWLVKQQAKKIIEKIRKEYVRTGDAEIIIKGKKDISKSLYYLQQQNLISYEGSSTRTNRHYIIISEVVDERTKNA